MPIFLKLSFINNENNFVVKNLKKNVILIAKDWTFNTRFFMSCDYHIQKYQNLIYTNVFFKDIWILNVDKIRYLNENQWVN